MCGISGLVTYKNTLSVEELKQCGKRMTDAIAHRGPDDEGHWVDAECGIVLGQRRLSIIDLSPLGHQPMVSSNGQYVIVFNGEIYNFLKLRQELEKSNVVFKGNSDTEVLIEAIQCWGLERTLQSIYGMFAFALWDRKNKVLSLARDHVGKKPLYFGKTAEGFVFGSELKALVVAPGFQKKVNDGALNLYMRHNYVPAPWSIYESIFKLKPGSFISLNLSGKVPDTQDLLDQVQSYWSFYDVAHTGQKDLYGGSFEQATDALEELLLTATQERMIADVPVGAFLSGGIDSSLIVALMQKSAKQNVKTYSIGFEESGFNEAPHAEAVAAHLETDHTTFFVTSEETMDVIPMLPEIFDEPFADMSQIPTWHVCRLARQNVTVALSGDGGDESFAGYERYVWAENLINRLLKYPHFLRMPVRGLIHIIPASAWDFLLSPFQGILRKATGKEVTGHRLQVLSTLLGAKTGADVYLLLMSHWKSPHQIVSRGTEYISPMTDAGLHPMLPETMHNAMVQDTLAYLPDDILVKVDRASMSHSLEVRAPLLDKNVIEWAWSLPMSYKFDGGGKVILKNLLNRYVPSSITDRPKQGFGVPMALWLRGPLRDWAESLLSEDELRKFGLFHSAPIRKMWHEHLSESRDWNYYLWDVLMAQAWAQKWL